MDITLPCVPSILYMLDGLESETGQPVPKSIQNAYTKAFKDALEMCEAQEKEEKSSSNIGRASGAIQNSSKNSNLKQPPRSHSITISTKDFLDMKNELDKLNDDLVRRAKGTGEEESKFLSVDAFDSHAQDTLDKSLKSQVKKAENEFHRGNYKQCIEILEVLFDRYTIDRLNPYILQNIAACYYRLHQWDLVICATKRALGINPNLDVGHRRMFRAYLITDQVSAAKEIADQYKKNTYWSDEIAALKAYANYQSLHATHLYTHALRELEELARLVPCPEFEVLKVQLLSLDRTVDGVRYAEESLKRYPYSIDLKYWRAELRFRLAASPQALQEVLKEMEGEAAATNDLRFRYSAMAVSKSLDVLMNVDQLVVEKQWEALITFCTNALKSSCLQDGLVSYLLAARSRGYIVQKDWYSGIDDITKALHYAEEEDLRSKLFLLLALCEEGLQRWQDAVFHAEKSHRFLQSDESLRVLNRMQAAQALYKKKAKEAEELKHQMENEERRRAQQEAERWKRQTSEEAYENSHFRSKPNLGRSPPNSYASHEHEREGYERKAPNSNQKKRRSPPKEKRNSLEEHFCTLSLPPTSNSGDVKKTYRALAMRWHPDKWSGRSPEEISNAEMKFKEIQNAYEYLMQKLK